jgi:hypothetical protein
MSENTSQQPETIPGEVHATVCQCNVCKPPFDFTEFAGYAIGMLPHKVRQLRAIAADLENGTVQPWTVDDLKAMVSDMTALLNRAPESMRSLIII